MLLMTPGHRDSRSSRGCSLPLIIITTGVVLPRSSHTAVAPSTSRSVPPRTPAHEGTTRPSSGWIRHRRWGLGDGVGRVSDPRRGGHPEKRLGSG